MMITVSNSGDRSVGIGEIVINFTISDYLDIETTQEERNEVKKHFAEIFEILTGWKAEHCCYEDECQDCGSLLMNSPKGKVCTNNCCISYYENFEGDINERIKRRT